MKLDHVVIARPGGNDTALIFDAVDKAQYREINSYIQKKRPEIEQVMFVKKNSDGVHGNMAGGEFCGNATRALGYYLLQGKNGTIDLRVSGASTPLTVTVKDHQARTAMPVRQEQNSVRFIDDKTTLVHMEGISHLICEPGSPIARATTAAQGAEEKKRVAYKALDANGLLSHPASGVMVLSGSDADTSLTPYVYVKDINTFYEETACGSGSVAVGLVRAKRRGCSVKDLRIRQPSGKEIAVDVDYDSAVGFGSASITGEVQLLYEGAL